MLITLKQKEIEAALRLYISQRGINLAGKGVDIAFTAGRKESGVSAEVNIEDDTVITDIQPPPAVVQAFNDLMLTGTGIVAMTAVDPASIHLDATPTPVAEVAPPFDVTPPPVVEAVKKNGVSLFS